jgi:hypothetical protein
MRLEGLSKLKNVTLSSKSIIFNMLRGFYVPINKTIIIIIIIAIIIIIIIIIIYHQNVLVLCFVYVCFYFSFLHVLSL